MQVTNVNTVRAQPNQRRPSEFAPSFEGLVTAYGKKAGLSLESAKKLLQGYAQQLSDHYESFENEEAASKVQALLRGPFKKTVEVFAAMEKLIATIPTRAPSDLSQIGIEENVKGKRLAAEGKLMFAFHRAIEGGSDPRQLVRSARAFINGLEDRAYAQAYKDNMGIHDGSILPSLLAENATALIENFLNSKTLSKK